MQDNVTTLGALARRGHDFCPYAAVAKFPYKYISKGYLQPVSEVYFAAGQFRARGWTLYYIHPDLDAFSKPLILVPALEVEALLYDINQDFGTSFKMPKHEWEPGFILNFDDRGSPRPRYLGRVNGTVSVEDMEVKIPSPGYKANGETDMIEDRSFAAFKAKIEAAIQATKNKTKTQKEKKKKERVSSKRAWCAQLQRTQCYLGLRPRRGSACNKNPIFDGSLSWTECQEAQKAYDLARSTNLPKLDPAQPVPYLFDQNVVFVCVDVEAWEKDHSVITEIGVCTLDTKDLKKLPSGEEGMNWMTAIRPRHFRIFEHKHLINTEFIVGCADKFEKKFGESSFISIKDAPQIVASCFKDPFSSSYRMKSRSMSYIADSLNELSLQANPHEKRNIVLVGHDVRSDIGFLRKVGYDVSNLSNLLEAIDTADMFKALMHEQNSRNLGGVLLELEIIGWNLHNAGNDAAYTLQAMIGLAFAALQDKKKRQVTVEARIENATKEAEDRVKEERDEWEAADVEDDGGAPVALLTLEEERRSDSKGGSKTNYSARLPPQRNNNRYASSKFEPGSTGLFIHNVRSGDEAIRLFSVEDERAVTDVVNRGRARWSVHFSTYEAAKAAYDRQPMELKVLLRDERVPRGERKPYMEWYREHGGRSSSRAGREYSAGNDDKKVYVPVTEWDPEPNGTSQGQSKGKVTKAAAKPVPARMKSRMLLLDEHDGGVKVSQNQPQTEKTLTAHGGRGARSGNGQRSTMKDML